MAKEPAVPEDILLEVLQRLAPHDLARSRRVCKTWRHTVDSHLRGQLLSHSVHGIFINYTDSKLPMSEFFSRPLTGPMIRRGLNCFPGNGAKVTDHCNGLLLCRRRKYEYVVNPATRRWARLPQRPPPHVPGFGQAAYLVFDHAVSPHYEVYLIPHVPSVESNDTTLLQTEWPPASYVMHVFSSMTGRWDKKTFIREGEAAVVIADMALSRPWAAEENRAVYWRGVLYIHGQCHFVMRLCLSNSKYQVIKMPDLLGFRPTPHLGRSMRGVYCAISHTYLELQIWYLDESCSQTKWVLKHDHKFCLPGRYGQQMDKHWIFQDINYRKSSHFEYDRTTYGNYGAPVEEKYEWNSDDDNIILENEHVVKKTWWTGHIGFLGFHPYKEVVFLTVQQDEAVSYDWNTSKFQYLGNTLSKHYQVFSMQYKGIDTCFPYTPCWMYEFPRINSESQLSGKSLETQVEGHLYGVAHGYKLRKLRVRLKRAKDCTTKIRQRHGS